MKKEEISDAISQIDDRYINEALEFKKKRLRFSWAAAAACLAVLLIAVSAAYAVAAEAREYSEAVLFFEENGLPVDNLSRSDVKAVYRDIVTNSFTDARTAEVLRSVQGWELDMRERTPEELAELWNRNVVGEPALQEGIQLKSDIQYVFDEEKGFDVMDRSTLSCRRDGILLWETEFEEFCIEGYNYTDEATAVWGCSDVSASGDGTVYAWAALVDENGSVLWKKQLEHGFAYESVGAVLSNGDGTWAVLSRGNRDKLCLSRYDSSGSELEFRANTVGNLGIWNAVSFKDGYLIQMGNQTSGDTALLYMMDRSGNLTNNIEYTSEDYTYTITDMTEYGGKSYLSAYAVPKGTDPGGRHEIAGILDYIYNDGSPKWDITSDELTPVMRGNYSAVLFICSSEGGEPETFYTAAGALGGELQTDEQGQLQWEVQSIFSSFYSPATSAFSIGAACNVVRYTFDGSGRLTGQEDTGETVSLFR